MQLVTETDATLISFGVPLPDIVIVFLYLFCYQLIFFCIKNPVRYNT